MQALFEDVRTMLADEQKGVNELNRILKIAMIECNLKQWQVAKLLNVSESKLSTMLRDELPEDQQKQIANLIRQHVKGGKNDADQHS